MKKYELAIIIVAVFFIAVLWWKRKPGTPNPTNAGSPGFMGPTQCCSGTLVSCSGSVL